MRCLNLLLAACLLLPLAAPALAYEAGDLVVVIHPENGIRDGGNKVADAHLGIVLQVRAVQGEWLSVFYTRSGWIMARDVTTLEGGVQHFTNLLRQNPRNAEYLECRGTLYRWLGEYDAALADLNAAVEIEPSGLNHNQRGLVYHDIGEYEKAVEDFTRYIEEVDDYATAFENRGVSYQSLRDHASAIQDFNAAIRLDPNSGSTYFHRCASHRDLGQYAEALVDARKAVELDENDVAARNRLVWLLAGVPDDSLRDGELAVEIAQGSCEMTDWQDDGALEALAGAYAETGDFESALRYEEQAMAIYGEGSDYQDYFDWRLGEYRAGNPYRYPVFDDSSSTTPRGNPSNAAGNSN